MSIIPVHEARISRAEIRKRVGEAMGRNLPLFLQTENAAREWVVVGGGPSINDHPDTIRRLKRRGAAVVTVNKSHDWALEHGIVPWAHVMLDPMEWVADYVKRPRMDVRYFVASQCHASVFDALAGYPVFLWHGGQDIEEDGKTVAEPYDYLKTYWPRSGHAFTMLGGGTTVGLRTPIIGQVMGPVAADKFHLIGFDSSRSNGKLHGYDKPEAKDATSGTVYLRHGGKKYGFSTNSHMYQQTMDFDRLIDSYSEAVRIGRLRKEFCVTVYGSGLLPFRAAQLGLHAEPQCNADPSKVGGYEHIKELVGRPSFVARSPIKFPAGEPIEISISPDDFVNLDQDAA